MNPWKSVFIQSRANNGCYDEDYLPQQAWRWPAATWFRTRLGQVREQEPTAFLKSFRKLGPKGSPRLN